MDTLGKRIKFVRESLNLSQSQMARELGLETAMAISKYESDQREPDITKLIKISIMGNITYEWLLTGEGSKYREERKEVIEVGEIAAQEEPRLAGLVEQLVHIYKEGDFDRRAKVRGVIEEAYDEITELKKKVEKKGAVQAAEEKPQKKKRRAAG